jgi:hypothetical protein
VSDRCCCIPLITRTPHWYHSPAVCQHGPCHQHSAQHRCQSCSNAHEACSQIILWNSVCFGKLVRWLVDGLQLGTAQFGPCLSVVDPQSTRFQEVPGLTPQSSHTTTFPGAMQTKWHQLEPLAADISGLLSPVVPPPPTRSTWVRPTGPLAQHVPSSALSPVTTLMRIV